MSDADDAVLHTYTIYSPTTRDYPGKWVVRRWDIIPGHSKPVPWLELIAKADSLEEARSALPEGLFLMPRADEDDPVIYETWI